MSEDELRTQKYLVNDVYQRQDFAIMVGQLILTKNRVTMVGHRPVDQDEIQAMVVSGGLKPAALRKRQKIAEAFSKYISENYGLDSSKTLLEGDSSN